MIKKLTLIMTCLACTGYQFPLPVVMSQKKKFDDQSVAHLSMPVPLNRRTTATEIRPAE